MNPRHRLNPLRHIPPELWPVLWRGLIGTSVAGAATAVPVAVVKQVQVNREQAEQLKAANENTNGVIGIVAVMAESLAVFRRQMGEFEREQIEARLRERRLAARMPEALVGPSVPYTWEVKPAKKHWWSG